MRKIMKTTTALGLLVAGAFLFAVAAPAEAGSKSKDKFLSTYNFKKSPQQNYMNYQKQQFLEKGLYNKYPALAQQSTTLPTFSQRSGLPASVVDRVGENENLALFLATQGKNFNPWVLHGLLQDLKDR